MKLPLLIKQFIAASLLALLAIPGPLAAQTSWPEFRGTTAQGISVARNLPTTWNAAPGKPELNVAWKTPIRGEGWSSPVVAKDRVYLTSALTQVEAGPLCLEASCVDARDGKIVWQTCVFPDAKSTSIHRKNGNASPTPILENDRLYVHFGHLGTACLSLDGVVVWKRNELTYNPVHGNGGSPALIGDLLIVNGDGAEEPFVAALDKKDGSLRWKQARVSDAKKKFSFSTPTIIELRGVKQIVTAGSGVVTALNPKDGSEIWRVRYGEGYSVVPRPVFAHGMLYIATGFDRPAVLAVKPDGHGDVTGTHVVWTASRGAPNTPSLLVVEDRLYMISDAGILTCLEAKTGKELWQERIGGNFSASPLLAEGRIYLQSEEGTGTVLDSGKSYHKLAQNELGERSLASYAVTDGALFIRGASHLFRMSLTP